MDASAGPYLDSTFPPGLNSDSTFFVWPATSLHLSSALHAAPSSRADASVTADGRLANPAPRRLEGCREGSAAAAHSSSCRSAPTARRQPVTTTTHHRQAKATTTRARRATGSPRRRWSRPRRSSGRDSPRTRGSRSRRARASRGRWSGATPPRRATPADCAAAAAEAAARRVAAARGLRGPRGPGRVVGDPDAGIECADARRSRRCVAVFAAARVRSRARRTACCGGDAHRRSCGRNRARTISFVIICCMNIIYPAIRRSALPQFKIHP